MPDILYTSPATNRSYKWVPEDPNYVPTESDIKDYAAYIEQQEGGLKQSALGSFGSGVGQGLATMPGTVLQGVGAMVGSTGLEEAGKYSAQQAREAFPIDPMRREDFTTKAGQAVGQAIGQLGLAIGTGGGSLSTVAVLGSAAAMGAASGSDRAADSGLTGARRMGRIYGSALVELGSERLFGLGSKSFLSPTKIPSTLGRKVLRAAGTAGGEGAEEVVAGVGNNILDNLTALGLDIPTPDIVGMKAFKSYAEQGLLGMVGGTVFAGAQLALGNQATENPITEEDAAQAPTAGAREILSRVAQENQDQQTAADVLARAAATNAAPPVTPAPNAPPASVDPLDPNAPPVTPPATPPATPGAPPVTPAPVVTPAPEPTAVVSPVPEVAPTAAQSVDISSTDPTNLVDLANAGFTGTITQTTPPDATQIREVSEGNIVKYPSGNEVGKAPETGDSNRPVEGRKVEPAPVAQGQEVVSPEPAVNAPESVTFQDVIDTPVEGTYESAADAVKRRQKEKTEAKKTASKAAPAPAPTAPATTQDLVDSIQGVTDHITEETSGTGSTAPDETIFLQQGKVPTVSLPAAETPMTEVSGGGVASTAAPTSEAAQAPAPEATPAAAATAAETPAVEAEPSLESVEDIPVDNTRKEPEPAVAETGDTSVLGKIKSTISQFMSKENPLSPKEVQSYRKLLAELVRPYYFDGASTHDPKNDEKFYKFVDILQNGDAVNKLRELGIEINADLGANDALPGAILVELYKYANSAKNSDQMLQRLETVGSTFYYNVGGSGRASARGLGIIQFGLKELARAEQTSIANKARLESASTRTGLISTDIEGIDKAAATAVVDGDVIAAALEGVALPNGESVAAVITSLLTPQSTQKTVDTRTTPGEQTPAEADIAAQAARERLENEAKGNSGNNEQIGDNRYSLVEETVASPTINATKARELIAKKLGFTPKNVSYENTDIPNENGNQYSGKVNLATKQITINLRNIKDSAHLEDVLIEEMDHLVYADPMVQAEIALLAENLPDDIKAEVASLRYKPEVQREEATIRFMRRLANEPNTSSLWKKFVDAVRAAFRRLFNGRLTERDLKMAADRVAARSFYAMAAQTFLTGQGEGRRYSFAGERSIKNFSGELGKVMADSLDAAKAMAAAGKSSEEIRAVTGWFPGLYDGKLRYEVSDKNASFVSREVYNEKTTQVYGGPAFGRINVSAIVARVKSGKVVRLSEVFRHDALFAAYPEAANIPFFPIAGSEVQGSHRVIDGQDVITATVTTKPDGSISEESASTILHELQHFIQQREGFAVGGSPDNLITAADLTDAAKFGEGLRGVQKYEAEIAGMVSVLGEERAKKSFLGFGGPNQKTIRALEDSITRVQESVNSIWAYQKKNLNIDKDSTRASLLSAINRVDSKLGGAWALTKREEGLYMLYRLLAGEIEARDVQARQNLTPEQRKAMAPYSSENIAKEDAIVEFDSSDPQMSISPESQRIDQEYLAAVEAGDMETAQRIVDEAAKAAGYTERMFHGTSSQPGDINSSITRFAPPSWWTRDKAQAQRFANATVEGWTPKVYEAYLNVGQSMELSSPQAAEDFIRAPWMQEIIKSGKTPEGTPDTFTVKGRDWLIPLRADQVKSADPVTRDDAGNIIPPSKRFQKTSDDIRYSLPDPNEPAPDVPDVGPNKLTREAVALDSVLDRLSSFVLGYKREASKPKTAAKKAAAKKVAKKAAAPKPKKEEVDPNISAVKKFIEEFKSNSGVEKADAEPKAKNMAKETLQRYTKLPTKKDGPGYPLDPDGETAFMSDLTQELVDLGVPLDLAAKASAYAWARYSTKKQDQIDKKALSEYKKAEAEKDRQEKRTAAEAQAAKDKPNNTAKDYIKNASAAPSAAKAAIKNPVTQALNEAAKIPRKGPAFDSSPQAKNAFMTGLSSKLMSLGVDSQTAWTASNVAWGKYQTALEAKAASLLKEFEKNIPATLARKIKELPVFRQNDADYVKQYIKDLFIFAGLTPEVAEAATTLYSAKYAQMLKDARVKAATKYIENEASPKTKDVLKKRPNELDKILEAIRLGVTDPSMTVALALSDRSKFQVFTQEEHNRMVALEEEINDEDTPNLIKIERAQELVKLAESKMNDFNAIKAFTGYLVGNTLSGIGTAAIQIWTPAYSMGNRLATDGMRGLITGDPKRFIASLSAFMNSAATVTTEFKYAFGNDVYRRGQQAELQTLSELRKVLDKNIAIYQNPKSGVEKAVAIAKIALAAPDYVRRLYSSMDTASQSLFINQIRQVGLYDLLRKNGMDMKKFDIMLEAKRAYRDGIITTLTLEGKYTPTQIRLIAEDSAIEDFGVRVAEAIGADGAQQVADLFRTSVNEGKSEIGVSDQVDGHAIPAILKILEGVKSAVDSVAGEKGQGAGDLAFRLIIGYPTTALKVLNRSLYFFPPTAASRYLLNRYYEKQPGFDPKADRVYPLLETHSQKLQRLSEGAMGAVSMIILAALLWEDKDKEEKDRRFAVHNLGPSDRAAKQAWRAAGNVQQSIQWRASETSPWISVSWAKAGLEALAPVLAFAGTVYDIGDDATEDTEFSDQVIKAASGFMGVFNRPLSGINDIGEILSGEKNSVSQKSLASYTAFRASGLVPFSSLLKTVNRLEGPRDMSTATSTMLSQLPIAGPMLTEPALNMFGDPLGATPNELSYKLPILPVQVGLRRQDVPFYEKILSKGQYPPLKLRTNFEKTYGPVTDSVWRQYVEKRGQMVKKLIIDRWTDLDKLSPEAYDKVLGKFANAADDVAIQDLNIRRLPK